jgi:hypothetical protein
MQLEDRNPPGTLMATGLGVGGLEDPLAQPDRNEPTSVLKRWASGEKGDTPALDSTTAPPPSLLTEGTAHRRNAAVLTIQKVSRASVFQQPGLFVPQQSRLPGARLSDGLARAASAGAATTSADQFLERYGSGWTVQETCGTNNPSFIYGRQFMPTIVPNAPADQAPGQWEASARQVVDENPSFFGFGSDSLKLDSVHVLALSKVGSSDKVAVTFKQYVHGLPVLDGSVSILFDAARKTVLALDTTGVPFADRVAVNTSGQLRQEAVATARAAYAEALGVPATQVDLVEPMIVGPSGYFGENSVLRDRGATFAYHVKLSSPGLVDAEGNPVAGEVFVADDLSVLKVDSTVENLNPIQGNVRGNVNTGQEPNDPTNQEQPFLPNVWIKQNNASGSVLATTNVNGRFRFTPASSPINLFVELRGPYFNVNNIAGSDLSFTVSAAEGTSQSFVFNPTKAETTTSQVAAAYWVNTFRNFVKGIDPTDTHMDFSVTANVNLSSTCNAYYDGSSINFYHAGGGCPNTAYATVINHEEGHWANEKYNGSVSGAFHEGVADAWAYYINDTSCLAPDFFGPGTGCLRDGTQTAIKKCTSSACNETCHGGEVHTEGQVIGSALWKVRANLEASLGQAVGGAVASNLFLDWFQAYNDNAICNVIEDHWLTLDDDDGDLSNGTPHKAEIDAGFVAQGWPGVP